MFVGSLEKNRSRLAIVLIETQGEALSLAASKRTWSWAGTLCVNRLRASNLLVTTGQQVRTLRNGAVSSTYCTYPCCE